VEEGMGRRREIRGRDGAEWGREVTERGGKARLGH